MPEHDIQQQNWPDFLREFCRKHETWLVDVDAFRFPAGQPDEIARDLHLRDIVVAPGGGEIQVVLRRSDAQSVVHSVISPSRVIHLDTGDARREELQIQGANTATVLRFHGPGERHLD